MQDDLPAEPSSLSEDQRAVAEYFASDRYLRRGVLPEKDHRPPETWNFENPAAHPTQQRASLLSGLLGLAGITLVFGVAFPIEIELLNAFNVGRPTYGVMMIMMQTMIFPPIIGFSFAAVAPLFWYGSVILRFAMAIAAVLPGCIGFFLALTYFENAGPGRFWHGFAMVMFTCLMANASIAVTVQMWSRYTLSHDRVNDAPLPPLGIGSLIQLTAIAAIGCAVFVSNDFGNYLGVMLLFGGVSSLAAIAIISTLIAYFRAGDRNRVAAIIGFVVAFCAAFVMNGFFASQEFGRDVISAEFILIGFISLYGAGLICGLMWICLRWLRFCGWRCINRKQERMSLADPEC